MFLTETDTRSLSNEETYIIKGYKTILPIIKMNKNLVRIICLVKEVLMPKIKVRLDLMSVEFPSIWLEYQTEPGKKPIIISGFYRVWTKDGDKSSGCQEESIEVFTEQIDKAFKKRTS